MELLAICAAAFGGAMLSQPFLEYVMRPLGNRREHKRLLDKQAFRAQWGRNPLSFFIRHGGFRRG
jgi:hypothetical protein